VTANIANTPFERLSGLHSILNLVRPTSQPVSQISLLG
jgi:hypothetical protein